MTPQELLQYLEHVGLAYQNFEHDPVFTVAESKYLKSQIPGGHTKNLFLKDDKKQLWLISALQDTIVNLRNLAKELPAKNLRFAQPELLREHLGVEPGSVTWFALINDQGNHVKALLDRRIFEYKYVGFHPLQNNATTVIKSEDLKTFAESCNHTYHVIDLQ